MSTVRKNVLNGSKGGRPARLSDEELQALVESLADTKGAPTLDAIIQAAGGCQRSRAVKARKAYLESVTQDGIQLAIKLPEPVELQHKKLLMRWLQLARDQASEAVAPAIEAAEQRSLEMELVLGDVRAQLDTVQETNTRNKESMDKLKSENAELTSALQHANHDLTRWRALADERERVISKLTDG